MNKRRMTALKVPLSGHHPATLSHHPAALIIRGMFKCQTL